MIVYIHNALLVPYCTTINTLIHDLSAMVLSAVLAQFKTNVTARRCGSVNVIFIHFSVRSLALSQQCVGCASHFNLCKTSPCHKSSPLIYAHLHTHTHTKHNGPHQTLNCTTSLQIFEDSLLSSVLWIYSTVTDLAKFLGKSTWKKHQRSKYSWFVLLGFLMQKIPDKF